MFNNCLIQRLTDSDLLFLRLNDLSLELEKVDNTPTPPKYFRNYINYSVRAT